MVHISEGSVENFFCTTLEGLVPPKRMQSKPQLINKRER